MPETIIQRVPDTAPEMTAADFKKALIEIGGSDGGPGEYDKVAFIGETDAQLRHAFVEWLRKYADGKALVWRFRPTVGYRREDKNMVRVVSARLRAE